MLGNVIPKGAVLSSNHATVPGQQSCLVADLTQIQPRVLIDAYMSKDMLILELNPSAAISIILLGAAFIHMQRPPLWDSSKQHALSE